MSETHTVIYSSVAVADMAKLPVPLRKELSEKIFTTLTRWENCHLDISLMEERTQEYNDYGIAVLDSDSGKLKIFLCAHYSHSNGTYDLHS